MSATGARSSTVLRVLIIATWLTGANYVLWRWSSSLNWEAWWIALPLVLAETYSLIDVALLGLTAWRQRRRTAGPPPPDATVDVFITTYNEPVDLVMRTAGAARDIRWPHQTWILDDGDRPEMRAAAEEAGLGYIRRSSDWQDRPRHAKAGNLNNALMQTSGEFILILDADQVPLPTILDSTLGYFRDERVAFVQTPQIFGNVMPDDPLGSQAPLFYGPIQQGKDGWNAAFFCGSNAVLRREALMQLGIVGYVREVEKAVHHALSQADRVLRRARRSAEAAAPDLQAALGEVESAIGQARASLKAGTSLGEVTYELQQRVDATSRRLVEGDLRLLRLDLAAIAELPSADESPLELHAELDPATARQLSPLRAIQSVAELVRVIDVDRDDEAQPIMPLATISVTEDMATSMRLHRLGWHSAYHHQILAIGMAPDDLGTMLGQRLRWAQGTLQMMLRENPLWQPGLSVGQRLMYFSTMWSYLVGFAALAFFAAPIVFLTLGVLPVTTTSYDFLWHFVPFILISQVMFLLSGRGEKAWRGQQYTLALFPIWIMAVVTAAANVWFRRPLDFRVTPKSRQTGSPWRFIRPQLAVMAALAVAALIGLVRLALADADVASTLVNLAWVGLDLAILGVLIRAAKYRGYARELRRRRRVGKATVAPAAVPAYRRLRGIRHRRGAARVLPG